MTKSSKVLDEEEFVVAVVHGVGDPNPGATMQAVCDGIGQVKDGFCAAHISKNKQPLCYVDIPVQEWRFGPSGERTVKAAEVYWGDISLVRGNTWQLIAGLFANLLGLRFVVSHAMKQFNPVERVFAATPFYMARWILLPLYILLPILVLLIGFWDWSVNNTSLSKYLPENWTRSSPQADGYLTTYDPVFFWIAVVCLALGVIVTIWLYRRERRKRMPYPWDIALCFAIYSGLSIFCAEKTLKAYSADYLPASLSASIANVSVPKWVNDHSIKPVTANKRDCNVENQKENQKKKRDSFASQTPSFINKPFTVKFWQSAFSDLFTAGFWGKRIAENTPVELDCVKGVGRYMAINNFFANTVYFFLSAVSAILLFLIAMVRHAPSSSIEKKRAVFLSLLTLFVLVPVLLILITIPDSFARIVQFWDPKVGLKFYEVYWYEVGIAVWVFAALIGGTISVLRRRQKYKQWIKLNHEELYDNVEAKTWKTPVSQWDNSNRMPRLIVAGVSQCAIIIGTVIFAIVFFFGLIPSDSRPHGFQKLLYLFAPAVLFVTISLLIFRSPLRIGLDAGMDIVNHFIRLKNNYPIRDRIAGRFDQTIEHLLDGRDRPHLLIIAHSQGAVITIDAMIDNIRRQNLLSRVGRLTILTFGSPLTHIYQHYFTKDYPEFSQTGLKELAMNDKVQWLNTYRIDDFVGMHIDGPTEEFPVNLPMPPGGHTNYWAKDVLGSSPLCDHLPGSN